MGNLFEKPPADPRVLQYEVLNGAESKGNGKEIEGHIKAMREVLEWLDSYKPCLEPIRKALSKPSDMELQQEAFSALTGNVKKTEEFYTKAAAVADYLPTVLGELGGEGCIMQDLWMARRVVELLGLIYDVDQKKMMSPGLQNDFSFYRRSVGKFQSQASVSETKANQISMWIAEAGPTTAGVGQTLKKAGGRASDGPEHMALAKVANMCAWIVAKDSEMGSSEKAQLLKAMVQSMILFDRSHSRGVFVRTSGVMVRKCLAVLKGEGGQEGGGNGRNAGVVMGLKNGLKYSTIHYGDATTPGFVEDLLE
ncbi:hypothetical protein TrCOL_g3938 [Triparma columacea]|uniref:CYRIA/CYRIB Rac1 binding domain-containing protein n=1 Tax=Triparma columacea TaxID=722753 RepID=A0A9W7FVS8_9STRA|nr:hypothetical protein TrCOL_g3938 [Triparma columacea]